MRTAHIRINTDKPALEIIEQVSSCILGGGIVLYPSDTVYGLLCRADDKESVDRLSNLKGYKEQRPFILIVDGISMVESLTDGIDPEVREILLQRWPGRLTFVLPAGNRCPEWVRGEDNTVALRHPADPLSGQLLKRCGVPLVSTSANLSGMKPTLSLAEIPESILDGVDIILDAGTMPPSSPSTILRLLRSSQGRT
ncbi:MAG: threonylcarbamoyl-AMP synthase [Candidatus Aegiribacteria sp.]|nr:threonylcarbamoyl-AMP synthase [Candidatus Aegiribacteria sp.]